MTAVFEMCVGGDIGAEILLSKNQRDDYFLFNETAGTFVVEVADKNIMKMFNKTPYLFLGKTTEDKILTVKSGKNLFSSSLYEFKTVWKKPMRRLFP